MSERVAMLPGDTVNRIHWRLGTDLLVGVCHCGAEHVSDDPVRLWAWLLAHPEGHRAEPAPDSNEAVPAGRQVPGPGSAAGTR